MGFTFANSCARLVDMAKIREKHILWKEKKGIVTVLMLLSGKFFEFNPVGSTIWKCIAEGQDEKAIIDTLASMYDAPREKLAQDLRNFIEKMTAAELLEP